MNMIEGAGGFVQELVELASRLPWAWRRCPHCGSRTSIKWGKYKRHPWFLHGQETIEVQRYRCSDCGKTYSEKFWWIRPKCRYTRQVQRKAIDFWIHGRSSYRRLAEMMRSDMGKQERWQMWVCLRASKERAKVCFMHASTICRWMKKAGIEAKKSIPGQLEGIESSGEMGTDGLWVRMAGKAKGVILALMDSKTGLIYPPFLARDEKSAVSWKQLFDRAKAAGLNLQALNGVTSDGAHGLLSFLRKSMPGVHHQRCVWHIWRNLGPKIRRLVAQEIAGKVGEEAEKARVTLTRELTSLIHRILDAATYEKSEEALAKLAAHRLGTLLADYLRPLLDAIQYYQMPCHSGLLRVGPEWMWRDFRQRVSRGRNHGADDNWERAALLWAIYWNFTPAQRRSEQKRTYRRSGKSPLEMAGIPPGDITYLDALRV